TNENTPLAGDVSTNDTIGLDGGTYSLVIVPTNAAAFTFNANGTFSYTPTAGFNGTDGFVYLITDSDGETSQATVTITVNPVDDLPVGVNDAYTTSEGTALVVNATAGVLANDTGLSDGGITLLVTAGPAFGAVTLNNDGSFTYAPNASYVGADSFTYQITDADGDTAMATVSIAVRAVGASPIANEFIAQVIAPLSGPGSLTPPPFGPTGDRLMSPDDSAGDIVLPGGDSYFQPIPRANFGWLMPGSVLEEGNVDEPPPVSTEGLTVKAAPPTANFGGGTLGSPNLGVLRPELETVSGDAVVNKAAAPEPEAIVRAPDSDGASLKVVPQAPDAGMVARPPLAEDESGSVMRTASEWAAAALAGLALLWAARRAGLLSAVLRALPGAGLFGLIPPVRDEEEEEEQASADETPRR
ncbi:MAG: cadherin-like domain-containing protein, partial [Burkholderiales bacterium]